MGCANTGLHVPLPHPKPYTPPSPSARCGNVFSSSSAKTAGSASLWWLAMRMTFSPAGGGVNNE